ncbi:uncharacterized protein LOC126381201 [Pectinophora gossypiella]|uniref:uncharacterized protein LOC126381201 n=1 Tax=Pectinophora gossypiella TaxID=13191 RepID=UPI00214E865F|nr:uncharacterized protein LOC126381201 [Pectinophora gossypiella]
MQLVSSSGSQEAIHAALLDATNIELQGVLDSDSGPILVEVDIEIMDIPNRPSAGSRLSDYEPSSVIQAPKNFRAHVINQEFTLRKDRYSDSGQGGGAIQIEDSRAGVARKDS